jgi:hypothetical protein
MYVTFILFWSSLQFVTILMSVSSCSLLCHQTTTALPSWTSLSTCVHCTVLLSTDWSHLFCELIFWSSKFLNLHARPWPTTVSSASRIIWGRGGAWWFLNSSKHNHWKVAYVPPTHTLHTKIYLYFQTRNFHTKLTDIFIISQHVKFHMDCQLLPSNPRCSQFRIL